MGELGRLKISQKHQQKDTHTNTQIQMQNSQIEKYTNTSSAVGRGSASTVVPAAKLTTTTIQSPVAPPPGYLPPTNIEKLLLLDICDQQ